MVLKQEITFFRKAQSVCRRTASPQEDGCHYAFLESTFMIPLTCWACSGMGFIESFHCVLQSHQVRNPFTAWCICTGSSTNLELLLHYHRAKGNFSPYPGNFLHRYHYSINTYSAAVHTCTPFFLKCEVSCAQVEMEKQKMEEKVSRILSTGIDLERADELMFIFSRTLISSENPALIHTSYLLCIGRQG